jgi:hypothetical protein
MKYFKSFLVPVAAAMLIVLTLFAFNRSTNRVEKTTNEAAINTLKNPHSPTEKGVAVLELFTSEGCSSCPPADDVLRDLAKDSNVVALSYHVTYWNRLGWKDSFSQKIFDERQYRYGDKFKANGVYTPQAVINGAAEMVGSKRGDVSKAVKLALETPAIVKIDLKTTVKDGEIEVKYTLSGDVPKDAVVQFALVESGFATKVKRGENNGQTLKHDNVVRDFEAKEAFPKNNRDAVRTSYTEGSLSFFPLSGWNVQNCSVVAFVQERGLGRIVGAAKMKL